MKTLALTSLAHPFDVSVETFVIKQAHSFRFISESIYDGGQFFRLLGQYDFVDVMTYTASRSTPIEVPIRYLLLEIGLHTANEIHYLSGIHTKLYLAYKKNKLIAVFIGSQNLVSPSSENLMVRVAKKENSLMKQYFFHYWNQVKQIKSN